MTKLKPKRTTTAEVKRPSAPVITSEQQPMFRHMEVSLADIERILDPHYTPEQEARRQKTLARVQWLQTQKEQQAGERLILNLDEFNRA